MTAFLQVQVSEALYLRDPEKTELGQHIVSDGIELLDELGFDKFTFKKLAAKIDSTEASIYRYFRSKHQFLQYVVSWYWAKLEYDISYEINNLKDPKEKLDRAISIIARSDADDPATTHVNEKTLHKIVVAEAARVYMTKKPEDVKDEELFSGYNLLRERLQSIIKELKPDFKFTRKLAMILIMTIHQQIFHTELGIDRSKTKSKKQARVQIVQFARHLVYSALGIRNF